MVYLEERCGFKTFPDMENALGPLSDKHKTLITVLETVNIEAFLPYPHGYRTAQTADVHRKPRPIVLRAIPVASETRNDSATIRIKKRVLMKDEDLQPVIFAW